ncbi:fimbria/pilus outer membrane usher protein [Bordetella pseudohinzii]|nr:fimbria/pilus outer membrane usher protein [Bordetella pseudohinzii]CUI39381.1 Heat shock protein E [Bordetella pseudohinzii]
MVFNRFPTASRLCLSLAASLAASVAAPIAHAAPELQAELQFDPRMLWGSASQADLRRFARRNVLQPGLHQVEVLLNEQRAVPMTVRFREQASSTSEYADALACLDQGQLETLGVNLDALDPALRAALADGACVSVKDIYPDSVESFDFATGQLSISVPQAYVRNRYHRDISPDQWQTGITAFRSNYSYSYNRYDFNGASFQSFSGLLDSGLNIGGWYLRNSAWISHAGGRSAFRSQRTTLQTDIPSWRARLVLGDIFAGSEYFSPYQMRGVMLSTDPAMLPYSERLYRPTVRGVAASQATVKILQANSVIYQGSVAPGPFAIDDYSPIGYGGDLTVIVTESNGAVHRFTVPFGNAVRLIRKGQVQYAASAGRYTGNRHTAVRPWVAQLTGRWGVHDGVNLYGGVLAADKTYAAMTLGGAYNTPLGAISLDTTWAYARPVGQRSDLGTSYRLSYSKTLESTRTVVRLATLRYSSEGFWTLADTLARGFTTLRPGRPRGEFSLALSQPLGGYGSLYVSGALRNYWRSEARQTQWELGYGTSVKGVGVQLTASFSNGSFGRDQQVMLNFAIPISGSSGTLRTSLQQERNRGNTQRVSYDATVGESRALSYGLDVTRSADKSLSYGLNANYQGRYGQIAGALNRQPQGTQVSVNGSGGLVVHGGGVTLGQILPDSIGLIDAREAEGAAIANMSNASVDGNGYGLVPLSPYSYNEVHLSPENLSLDVELQSTVEEAIPRAGAVVPLVFKTRRERSALLVIADALRERLPFGSPVTDGQGATLGTTGQGGRALLRGLPAEGELHARLSDGTVCRRPYRLDDTTKTGEGGLPVIAMQCEEQP